jgi:hypothetical protein
MDMMKSELNQQQMSKGGLSDVGLEYDPNHPSIIEELLQVLILMITLNKARARVD